MDFIRPLLRSMLYFKRSSKVKITLKYLTLATHFTAIHPVKKTQFLLELNICISVTEHQHHHSVGEVLLI